MGSETRGRSTRPPHAPAAPSEPDLSHRLRPHGLLRRRTVRGGRPGPSSIAGCRPGASFQRIFRGIFRAGGCLAHRVSTVRPALLRADLVALKLLGRVSQGPKLPALPVSAWRPRWLSVLGHLLRPRGTHVRSQPHWLLQLPGHRVCQLTMVEFGIETGSLRLAPVGGAGSRAAYTLGGIRGSTSWRSRSTS